MANTEVIIPEILLIDKMEEMDNFLPTSHWENLRTEATIFDAPNNRENPMHSYSRRVYLSDFVNKAINLPTEIHPDADVNVQRNLYRLHLFCCQRAIHDTEVRRNPFLLHFKALMEMKEALIGIFLTYRLVNPSAPYHWSKEFFQDNLIVDTAQDGHPVIKLRFADNELVNKAITEELVTDWMIYRAYDNNGIRTLMDIKNNLLTLPDYKRGGSPASEFSRFERKFQEKRNRIEEHKNQELELEFRKTLVQNIAQEAVKQMMNSGATNMDILAQAFNGDIKELMAKSMATPQKNDFPMIENQSAETKTYSPGSVAENTFEIDEEKPKKKKKYTSRELSDDFSVDNILAKYGNPK